MDFFLSRGLKMGDCEGYSPFKDLSCDCVNRVRVQNST